MSEYMTLTKAATKYRIGGYNLSATTLWRWCKKGVGGRKMPHVKVGRRYLVTDEALTQFLDALATDQEGMLTDATPSSVQYRRHIEQSDSGKRLESTLQRLKGIGL